ncbi:hypothetical protein LX59_00031 [Azomonas agilis]|uniref:Topoisomerase II n=1 Tax=Azomonas agilis TaxID=116849 RepID=A0A562J1L2_9GAMM|nr:topoisomerase II [Azomonas agilis]TWH77129.1 hypothetical protein LX59_00031 [Azomonas agilis]
MSDALQIILEEAEGQEKTLGCQRLAVIWQGRELWIQPGDDGQLLIGVDDEEGDVEYANLLIRPLAVNLVSLELEMEPHADEEHSVYQEEHCCQDHDHHH